MLTRFALAAACAAAVLAGALPARAGVRDPSFGGGGVVRTDVGGLDSASDVIVQPDGKVLVAGTIDWNNTRNPFLVRYEPHGALDSGFGSGGIVIVDRYTQPPPRMALQPDGRILLATRSDDAPVGLMVLRFEPDGTPDPAFGTGGAAVLPSISVNSVAGIGVGGDGRISVGARLILPGSEAVGLARFTPDGSPDSGFGAGGLVTVEQPYSWTPLAFALDPAGRFLVGGFAWLPGRFFLDAFVARFSSDGALDPGFGAGGTVFIQRDTGTEVQALAVQRDGRILAGGRAWGPAYYESRWLLARFGESGMPDGTFGSAGTVEYDPSTGHDVILAIVSAPAGIYVAGQTETSPLGLVVARFDSNGALDAGFGTDGIAGVKGNTATGYNRLAVQADGKIVVAGSGVLFEPAFAVDVFAARYLGRSWTRRPPRPRFPRE